DPVAPEQPSSWLSPEARPGTSSVLPCSSSSRGFRASTRPGAIQVADEPGAPEMVVDRPVVADEPATLEDVADSPVADHPPQVNAVAVEKPATVTEAADQPLATSSDVAVADSQGVANEPVAEQPPATVE